MKGCFQSCLFFTYHQINYFKLIYFSINFKKNKVILFGRHWRSLYLLTNTVINKRTINILPSNESWLFWKNFQFMEKLPNISFSQKKHQSGPGLSGLTFLLRVGSRRLEHGRSSFVSISFYWLMVACILLFCFTLFSLAPFALIKTFFSCEVFFLSWFFNRWWHHRCTLACWLGPVTCRAFVLHLSITNWHVGCTCLYCSLLPLTLSLSLSLSLTHSFTHTHRHTHTHTWAWSCSC